MTATRTCLLVLLVFGVGLGLPGPLVPSLRAEFDIGYTLAAAHLTALSAGSALGSLAVTPLRRRLARESLLAVCLAVLAAGAALLAVAPTVVLSLVGVGLVGLGGVAAVALAQAALVETSESSEGAVLTRAHVAAAVGLTLAAALVSAARAGGTWRLAAALLAVAVVGLLLLRAPRSLAAPPTRTSGDEDDGPGGGAPLGRPAVVAIAVCGLAVAVEWAVTFWVAAYLRTYADLPEGAADAVTVAALLALLLGRVLVARLADRAPSGRLLQALLLLTAAVGGLYVAAPDLPGGGPLVVGCAALLGLSVAGLFPLSVAVALQAAPPRADVRERVSSLCLGSGAAVALVAPLSLGVLADALSLQLALVALPVLTLLAAALHAVGVRAAARGRTSAAATQASDALRAHG